MTRRLQDGRRSDCPLSVALEVFGDRWTLLILRDLLFKRFTTFKQFLASGERIATNILSDRLRVLQQHGIIASEKSATDARVITYRPTAKGLALLPTLVEMILWIVRYEKTAAPAALIERMTKDREGLIQEIGRRFSGPAEVIPKGTR